MQQNKTQDELTKAVLSKAVGCKTCEVIEEYAKEDGDITLVKKKITTKYLPPDMMAVKTLMALSGQEEDDLSKLTDEQLFKEKRRLLEVLKEMESLDANNKDDTQN